MFLYEIRVKGKPAVDWSTWFQEFRVRTTHQEQPELLLMGYLPDQSALLGVLMRLHNLNLTVVSVRRIEEGMNHDG